MIKIKTKITVAILTVSLAACSSSPSNADPVPNVEQVDSQAPETEMTGLKEVINQITEQEQARGLIELDAEMTQDLIGLDVSLTDEYYLTYGMGRFGIADIFIVKPKDGYKEEIVNSFKQHQQNRMATFEQYNVGGDYDKAKNALIYEQGDYIILLIVSNPEFAQQQIDNYFTQ